MQDAVSMHLFLTRTSVPDICLVNVAVYRVEIPSSVPAWLKVCSLLVDMDKPPGKVQSSGSHLYTFACLMHLESKRGVTSQLVIDRCRVFRTILRKQFSGLPLCRIPFQLWDLVGAKLRVRKFSKGHGLVKLPTGRLCIAGFHCSQCRPWIGKMNADDSTVLEVVKTLLSTLLYLCCKSYQLPRDCCSLLSLYVLVEHHARAITLSSCCD